MNLLYRYRAVALGGPSKGVLSTGELSGESPAEVRSKLRAAGLQVLELASHTRREFPRFDWLRGVVESHLRARRYARKEELFDGLATMLDAGVPLVEALGTSLQGDSARDRSTRRMLAQVQDDLRGGASLGRALAAQKSWFDPVEVALIEAGEHSGSLTATLRVVAARQQRRGQLAQKLAGALAYPCIVACVGLCVWLFLSTKTLPEFVRILEGGNVEVPGLTRGVMRVGQWTLGYGPILLLLVAALAALVLAWNARTSRRVRHGKPHKSLFGSALLRRLRLARFSTQLAELLEHGVPLVEGLRVAAPSAGRSQLRALLLESANAIEHGKSFSETLRDERWFSAEFKRLVELGEASGELAPLLARLGARLERTSERRIDRLATLLEPAVILSLAVLIGVVVMAAVLPITRLQELV